MAVLTWMWEHRAELLKFGTVGGVAFIVDIGLFNLLHTLEGAPLSGRVVTAKVISAAAATLVAWAGNRLWTFADSRTRTPVRELIAFGIVNIVALLIAALTVAVTSYGLGLRDPVSDNVAAVIGIGLGTIARYVGYKKFVFVGATAKNTSAR